MLLHSFTSLLLTLTLLLCGGYAGMALLCQIGVLPTMRQLDLPSYARVWKVMDGFMDRAMPPYKLSLLVINLAASVCLVMERRTALAAVTFVSFLCSVAALLLTIRKQIPLNKQLQSLPAGAGESMLLDIREQTVHNFAVRLGLAISAFCLLSVGVIFYPLG